MFPQITSYSWYDADPLNNEEDDTLDDIYARIAEVDNEGLDDGSLDEILESLGYR